MRKVFVLTPGTEKKIKGKRARHVPSLVLIGKDAENHLVR